jgi:hypothetical protein
MKIVVFDAEADGFLYDASRIHCIAAQVSEDSGATWNDSFLEYRSGLHPILDLINRADVVVGHNITGFDIPLINKLYPGEVDWSDKTIFDTFLGSCLVYPDNTHGHSIEAWAKQLKLPLSKIQISDWSVYTPEMGERCEVDVKINVEVWRHLKQTWLAQVPEVLSLEGRVAQIHAQQELHGVKYDTEGATELLMELDQKIQENRDMISSGVPAKCKAMGVVHKTPYKKDGTLNAATKKLLQDHVSFTETKTPVVTRHVHVPPSAVGPYQRVSFEPFNLDSPKQVQEFLLSQGWKPTEWNFKPDPDNPNRKIKSTPKLTESSWDSLPAGLGAAIGEYKMMQHRRRSIFNDKNPDKPRGALTTIRDDGRIPAEAMTCATPTSRYRHMRTVCNIPRPSSKYGSEVRGLFTVDSRRLMLGADLKGIEARMLCHYALPFPGGEELMDRVLSADKTNDFHSFNAAVWGVDRDDAKTGLYALMYGCGEAKLASSLGKAKGSGGRLFAEFWSVNPALKRLTEELEAAYVSGRPIRGLDRRVLSIREKRMALNTLLQGAAAVVFKVWMALIDKWLRESGKIKWVRQVIAYHDELQFELYTDDPVKADIIGAKINELAGRAGELLKIRVPIEADYKVGKNWAETH